MIEGNGVHVRLVVGAALGRCAPVRVFAPMFYLAAEFSAGGRFLLPAEYAERAIYALDADFIDRWRNPERRSYGRSRAG